MQFELVLLDHERSYIPAKRIALACVPMSSVQALHMDMLLIPELSSPVTHRCLFIHHEWSAMVVVAQSSSWLYPVDATKTQASLDTC